MDIFIKLGYLFFICLNALFMIIILGYTINPVSPRIIGGKNAPDGKYPYMASLNYRGNHFCGGSILNKRLVLTAAHCLKTFRLYPSQVTVEVGTNLLGVGGQLYEAKKLIIHEKWNSKKKVNDVGLILVRQDIQFGNNVKPISLPTKGLNTIGCYPAIISGWGLISSSEEIFPEKLQEISLKVINQCRCKRQFRNSVDINEAHICTYTTSGEGICQGDSGGPLVARGVQIGIASFVAMPCASGYPDVFARVETYVEWIHRKQKEYEAQ